MADAPRQTKPAVSLENRSSDVKEFCRDFFITLSLLYSINYKTFLDRIPKIRIFLENGCGIVITY
jgi:hypothetical protein